MNKRAWQVLLCASMALVPVTWCTQAQALTPADAAALGKAEGAAQLPAMKAGVNEANRLDKVPPAPAPRECMPPSADLQGHFGGGNGDLVAPSSALVGAAVGETTPECAAINYMQGRGAWINPIDINPVDPLLVNARNIRNNPGGSLGPTMGLFVPRVDGACEPGTKVVGGGALEQVCYEYAVLGDQTCEKPWILEIEPWWMYVCEKTPFTTQQSTCTKEEWVVVDLVENCETGKAVAENAIAWGYQHRSGADLYLKGGYVRAICNPALDNAVLFAWFVGDVSEHAYGSGADYNPEPDRSLIPPAASVNLGLTHLAWGGGAGVGGQAYAAVAPGSGCDSDLNCSYSGFFGSPRYVCSDGGLRLTNWAPDAEGNLVPTEAWAAAVDGHEESGSIDGNAPLACYKHLGAAKAVWDANAQDWVYDCAAYPGTVRIIDGQCYEFGGALEMAGGGAGSKPWSLAFRKPALELKVVDEGTISTCGGLEANASCTPTGSRCLEGPGETRNINGLDVYKDCWKTEYIYECRGAAGANFCTPLGAEPKCAQIGVDDCTARNADGGCRTYQARYRCTVDMGPPANVTEVGRGYEVVSDRLDTSQCDVFTTNQNCTRVKSDCIDTDDKTFFGFTFSRSCWKYQDTFTCPTGQESNCAEWEAQGCTPLPDLTACTTWLPSGECATTQKVFRCGTPAETVETGSVCDATPYCINGICYDTVRPGDPDFGRAVAMQETARQAGSYIDQTTYEIFKGTPGVCRRKLFGANNCCKADGGTGGGNTWTNSAFYAAANFGKQYLGSPYMYDMLYSLDTSSFMFRAMDALNAATWTGVNTFEAFGITVGWGPGGLELVGFDPMSFAIAIAVQLVITELTECPESDQQTAMKRAQGICELVGSYCSSKVLGACYTRKEAYCCFNSKLAKAINVQGKAQLGLSMGLPQAPDCRGLTIAEIEGLDFARIDLSEFLASVAPTATSSEEAKTAVANRLTAYAPVAPVVGAETLPSEAPPPAPLPPPPPIYLEPSITATWLTQPAVHGTNVDVRTSSTDATAVTYECTGAWVTSGSLPPGLQTSTLAIPDGIVGEALCMFTASNPAYDVTIQSNLTIGPPAPTVSAWFSPNAVPVGGTYTFTIVTTGADSASYSCKGRAQAGPLPIGTHTSDPMTASFEEVGTVVCTFSARNSVNGATANLDVSQVVSNVTPVLRATPRSPSVTGGNQVQIDVTTTNAVSLAYQCSGPVAASGSLDVPSSTLTLPTAIGDVGQLFCKFTATSISNTAASENATVNITP